MTADATETAGRVDRGRSVQRAKGNRRDGSVAVLGSSQLRLAQPKQRYSRIRSREAAATYAAAAISRVTLIGSLNTLHSAERFASRGRARSVSQK